MRVKSGAWLDLVNLIYDAAGDARLWPVLLQKLAEPTHSDFGSLSSINRESASLNAGYTFGMDAADARFFNETYSSKENPILRAARDRGFWTPGIVAAGHDICPELFETDYYNDYLRPRDLSYSIGGIILQEKANGSLVYLSRGRSAGPYTPKEASLLQTLMPHMNRSVMLHNRIVAADSKAASIAEVLNRMPIGVIIVEENGRVLTFNDYANDVISQNDGLGIKAGQILASVSRETNELSRLIRGADKSSSQLDAQPGGAMTVSRPSFRRPFEITVTPLAGAQSSGGARQPKAAVFITDPEREFESGEYVAQRFKLTPAETKLTTALMCGKTLKEAAEEFSVTFNTVRSQLQKIFEKTETNRQADLVRLVSNSRLQFRRS
jgi:DNA-binding CsgD family transcriptional regulator